MLEKGGIMNELDKKLKELHKKVSCIRKISIFKRNLKYYRGYDDALREVSNLIFNEMLLNSGKVYLERLKNNAKN